MDVNTATLFRAAKAQQPDGESPEWQKNLFAFVTDIRRRVLDAEPFKFSAPRVIAKEKKRGEHICRPLTLFPIVEKVVDSLNAKYLRAIIDPCLDDAALAFRCRRNGKLPPTNHEALQKISNLSRRHRERGMTVAECDIKGFFDCVDHTLALSCLHELIGSAKKLDPSIVVDKRSLGIYSAYLEAYSFPTSVLGGTLTHLKRLDPDGIFKWPEAELQQLHEGSPREKRIGVPQGGAHSCLIANVILHRADVAVRKFARSRKRALTYRRYCDDMILLSEHGAVCEEAFALYRATLASLRLPIHEPKAVLHYGKEFFDQKSNSPYRWTNPAISNGAVPWIQFVGYQVRWDGYVRVRRRSLLAHRQKITGATDDLLKVLRPTKSNPQGEKATVPPRRTKAQIIHRLRQRLISISVGHRVLSKAFESPEPMCWADGFRGLFGRKCFTNFLKNLDRHRERQLQRLSRALESISLPTATPTEEIKGLPNYSGAPFSYHEQFRKSRQLGAGAQDE